MPALNLLDATSDSDVDCLLGLACQLFEAAAVVLSHGTNRHVSSGADQALLAVEPVCRALVSRSAAPVVVNDARADDRLSGQEIGSLRFYAGVPVRLAGGEIAGILSVLDARPGAMTGNAEQALARLAGLAASLLGRQAVVRPPDLSTDLKSKLRTLADQASHLVDRYRIFDRAAQNAQIGVWECDLTRGNALRWSDGVYDIFGLPRRARVSRADIVDLYLPDSRAEMEAVRAQAIADRRPFKLDARIRTIGGEHRWMRLSGDVECRGGQPIRIFGIKQDITAEKAVWDRTRYMAEIDPMTGLFNRTVFNLTLSGAEDHQEPAALPGALLLIDLDGFKQINDTFGHDVGDLCLKDIAERLKRVCRGARLLARLGGDEFAVLIGAPAASAAVETLAYAILDEMNQPIWFGGHMLRLGASIGAALVDPDEPFRAEEFYRRADIALYAAKAHGKQTVQIFTPLLGDERDRRLGVLRTIGTAVAFEG